MRTLLGYGPLSVAAAAIAAIVCCEPPQAAVLTTPLPAAAAASSARCCRYERLQKIMILSATKRTSARMKFWFIKNYMSPQMKAFVPFMACKYDFDYE